MSPSTSAAMLKTKEVHTETHFCCILSYELHAVFAINKMLSYHAHFLLYLLQEIESILSHTTSCICRFCRIEQLYGRFPYSCICRRNFFRTTDTTYRYNDVETRLNANNFCFIRRCSPAMLYESRMSPLMFCSYQGTTESAPLPRCRSTLLYRRYSK